MLYEVITLRALKNSLRLQTIKDYFRSSKVSNCPNGLEKVQNKLLELTDKDRITSYNVCYTKLLRLIMVMEHHS